MLSVSHVSSKGIGNEMSYKYNRQWTIQRKRQHKVHKAKKNKTQYVLDTSMRKQAHIT